MEVSNLFLSLALTAALAFAGGGAPREPQRPRGVAPARAPLYAPGDRFACLDGSLVIPYSFVNDDYCDCRDGSDEPGTSACPNGAFHCENVGHAPLLLPSSRVNDGVCDCCDAADEYASGAPCVDTCEELGREARQRAAAEAHLHQAGAKLREKLVREGANAKADMRDRLGELTRNRAEAEQLKFDKEKFKTEAEALEEVALKRYRDAEEEERRLKERLEADENRLEAEDTFARFDSDGDGYVELSELKTRNTFDRNRDGEVADDEASYFLAENERLGLDEFVESAWPLIKPYLMLEKGTFKPPARDDEPELELDESRERTTESPEEDEDELDEPEHDDVESEDGAEERTEPEPEPETMYDDETRTLVHAATEARNEFVRAEKAVRDIDVEIDKLKGMLDKDYGANEEFATLAGQCLEYEDREYVYKLCPFDRASQQPRSGGSETNLGTWGEWVGNGDDKYSSMLYSHGLSCWNGPDRSTRVNVRCGLENRITGVAEPNRCEYVFEMETPAACVDGAASSRTDTEHDEL